MSASPIFYKPGGCEECSGHGFSGRLGIYELLVIDDAVGTLILQNADAQAIKRAAQLAGLDTLRDDGARKVLAGLTTVGEVLKAKQEDIIEEHPPSSRPAAVSVATTSIVD